VTHEDRKNEQRWIGAHRCWPRGSHLPICAKRNRPAYDFSGKSVVVTGGSRGNAYVTRCRLDIVCFQGQWTRK
jgi:hypothetical protein